jgi:hypothetical protein
MKRFFTITFLVLALFLAACGGKTAGIDTGITGETYLSVCTGADIAVDCTNINPYATKLDILDENMVFLQTVETEEDGTFIIALDPGTYYIHPQNDGFFPIAADFRVVVTHGELAEMVISYDIGER